MATIPNDTADNPSAITSPHPDISPPTIVPFDIMANISPTTVDAPTDKKLDKFRCFPSLPVEIRLNVWEIMAPTQHDALMGCRVSSDEEDDGGIDYGRVLSPLLHPDALAGRESCTEASEIWKKAKISTLFMPLRYRAMTSLDHLRINVDSIATLWPEPRMLDVLFISLQMREAYLHLEAIKTFFVGITAIVCDPVISPDAYNYLGEMRFKTFELGDPALLELLSKCNAPRKVHASDECFIATLHEYWETDQRNQELREAWGNLINGPNGELAPTMKPVVMAVSSMQQIELRAPVDFRTHLRQTKVSYSRETACQMEADFLMIPPHLRHRMLREHRCHRCWPPLL